MKESQLENKTAIATNDYVRMVDENNNSVKIKKDSFMAAIRDALPSIISDGTTGGGSVLSIINGALKTRTDANLASALGAISYKGIVASGSSLDDYTDIGFWYDAINASDIPSSAARHRTFLIVLRGMPEPNNIRVCQFIIDFDTVNTAKILMRGCSEGDAWSQWAVFTGSPV